MSAAMLYTAAIGALLATVALVTERIFEQLGWPRRSVWLISLTASLALPAYALLTYDASRPLKAAPLARPASADVEAATDADTSTSSDELSADWSRELAAWAGQLDLAVGRNASSSVWPAWHKLDRPLTLLWITSTTAMLFIFGTAWLGFANSA